MSIPTSLQNFQPIVVEAHQIKHLATSDLSATTVQGAISQSFTLCFNAVNDLSTTLSNSYYGAGWINETVSNINSAIAVQTDRLTNQYYTKAQIDSTIAGIGIGGNVPATSYYAKLAIYTTAYDNETSCTLRKSSTAGTWVETGSHADAYYTLNNKVCSMTATINLACWSGWSIPTGDVLFSFDDPTLFPSPKDTFSLDNIVNDVGWCDGALSSLAGGERDRYISAKFIKQTTTGQIGGFKILTNNGMFRNSSINGNGTLTCTIDMTYLTA